MRTLVIGGTRNLGPDLVRALLETGHEVTVLNRGITPGALPREARRVTADRSDAAAFRSAVGDLSFDLVVDTTLYTGDEANIAAAVLDGRAGRYVWWSTGQVYLVRTGVARPFREADYDGPLMAEPAPPAALDHRNWVYGMDKRHAEDVLATAFMERGFPAVSLRMPMIASERDHYTRIAAYVRRLLDGGPILVPEDPPLPVRHVYGRDVIAATLAAAYARAVLGRAFNVSQDETLTFHNMVARIGGLLDRMPHYAAVPRAALEEHGLLPTCSPFSDPWMSSLDNELSRHVLGIHYTPVDAYLPQCVEAALGLPPDAVVGYGNRAIELALAQKATA